MGRDKVRLGVNIDHVATLRNARGGDYPDPLRAALLAQKAGADGITAHLREDRRHISDEDILNLKKFINLPLNLEIAPTEEMLKIALTTKPNAVCLVPEKRAELTTEGGLNILSNFALLKRFSASLKEKGIKVSFFIDPDPSQVQAALEAGAEIVELHTGSYCHSTQTNKAVEFEKLKDSAFLAYRLGLECHAGHGLNFITAKEVVAIPNIVELNIGHFLIGESIFTGLIAAIKKMKEVINHGY